MGLFSKGTNESEGVEGIGRKREIHRGRRANKGTEMASKGSKKGWGTKKVKGLLRKDAKARKILGETRDSRGNRAIRGPGGYIDPYL